MRSIRCYCLGQDGGFRGWYDSQDDEIKAKMEYAFELLEVVPSLDKTPVYSELRGKCEGIGEVKVDVGDACYRLLAYEDKSKNELTILRWFRKLNNADYGSHCPLALKRKEQVLKDASRTEPWPFDEDDALGEEVP